MTGVSVRFMATSSALPGPVITCSDKATHAEGCDSGGPAIVELALVRPETLRHHLSVGLPLSESCGRHPTTSASHISCDAVHSSSSNHDVRNRRQILG